MTFFSPHDFTFLLVFAFGGLSLSTPAILDSSTLSHLAHKLKPAVWSSFLHEAYGTTGAGRQDNVVLVVGGSTVSNRTQVAENPEEHPAEYPAEPLVEERRSLEKATLTCECMVKRRKDVGGDMLLAWERAPSLMLGPRTLHAGVVVNGTLIVAGGQNLLGAFLKTLEIFTPDSSSDWKECFPPLSFGRAGHAMVALGDKIYAIGGYAQVSGKALRSVESIRACDLSTESSQESRWEEAEDLPQGRSHLAATCFNGRIFVFGGKSKNNMLSSVVSFDPKNDVWQEEVPMTSPRCSFTATVLGERIFVVGGLRLDTREGQPNVAAPTDTVESYCPKDGKWRVEPPLRRARSGHAAVVRNGILYIVGGTCDNEIATGSVETFSEENQGWSIESSLLLPRKDCSAHLLMAAKA